MASLLDWNNYALTHPLDLSFRLRSYGFKDMSSRWGRFLLHLSVVLLQTIQLFLCYMGYIKVSFIPYEKDFTQSTDSGGSGLLYLAVDSYLLLFGNPPTKIIKWSMCQNLNCINKRVPILQVRILCNSSLFGIFPPWIVLWENPTIFYLHFFSVYLASLFLSA